MRKVRNAVVATVIVVGTVLGLVGPASAHASQLSGVSVCNTQTGQYDITWTVQNDRGNYGPATVYASSNTSVLPLGTGFLQGQALTFPQSVPGTSTSVSLSERLKWTNDKYVEGTKTASLELAGTCKVPDVVAPKASIRLGTCKHRATTATLDNTASNVPVDFTVFFHYLRSYTVAAGQTQHLGFVGTGRITISSGGVVLASAVEKSFLRCMPPKPPVRIKPKVGIDGPCLDPLYAAIFDNLHSNRPVWFKFVYHAFAGGYRTIRMQLGAGKLHQTQFVHVLGYSVMRVYAAGKLMLVERSVAPGEYGPCH